MSDLSPEALDLLRKARGDLAPTPSELDAVRSTLFAKLGVAAPSAATSWLGVLGGKTGMLLLSAVLATGSYLALRSPAAPLLQPAPAVVHDAAPAAAPVRLEATPQPSAAVPSAALPAVSSSAALPAVSPSAALPAVSPSAALPAVSPSAALPARAQPRTPARSRVSRAHPRCARAGDCAEAPKPAPEAVPPPQPTAAPERARSEEPAAAAPTPDQLSREVALVRSARAAADRGEHRAAIALLNSYERRFGVGTLYQEQLALRARVLCASGELEQARAALARLATLAPDSAHLSRVCPELKTSR